MKKKLSGGIVYMFVIMLSFFYSDFSSAKVFSLIVPKSEGGALQFCQMQRIRVNNLQTCIPVFNNTSNTTLIEKAVYEHQSHRFVIPPNHVAYIGSTEALQGRVSINIREKSHLIKSVKNKPEENNQGLICQDNQQSHLHCSQWL